MTTNPTQNQFEQFVAKVIDQTENGDIVWHIDNNNYRFLNVSSIIIKQFSCELNGYSLLLVTLKDQFEAEDYNNTLYEELRIVIVVIKDYIPAQFIDKKNVDERYLWRLDSIVTQATTNVSQFISSYIK